jgi:hypothetical protein
MFFCFLCCFPLITIPLFMHVPKYRFSCFNNEKQVSVSMWSIELCAKTYVGVPQISTEAVGVRVILITAFRHMAIFPFHGNADFLPSNFNLLDYYNAYAASLTTDGLPRVGLLQGDATMHARYEHLFKFESSAPSDDGVSADMQKHLLCYTLTTGEEMNRAKRYLFNISSDATFKTSSEGNKYVLFLGKAIATIICFPSIYMYRFMY